MVMFGGIATVLVAVAFVLGGGGGLVHLGGSGSKPTPLPTPSPTLTLQQVLARAVSSAVTIEVSTLDGPASGSGFVVAPGGIVLTNAHVVDHAFQLIAVDHSGGKHQGRVIGRDNLHDVAAVRFTGLDASPLALDTSSAELTVGTQVYLVGNPGGDHPGSVVTGLISAVQRDEGVIEGRAYHDLYQLDTSNAVPGSSGSAVLTADGQVIGIDALGDNPQFEDSRFAYAIPDPIFRDEADAWVHNPSPIPVVATDLPWAVNPRQAVTQQADLRTGYTLAGQGATSFSPGGQPPPSDEVTFVLPAGAGAPGRRVFSRVIVYGTRADATSAVDSELGSLTDAGGTEQQPPGLGDDSHTLTQTASDGTDLVSLLWRDRNVLCLVQFQGLTGAAAVTAAVSIAADTERRVTTSPTVNPDS
jgi:hypothetical protein